ncbi:MAG: ABC transporter permease [Clostridia bacterium]|nr:ABC transporter permease [Clostridia bacterium]
MFLESVKMAFDSLRSNRMRAILTMLGIIVGIASVIAIVSLGEGGKTEVMSQFDKIGASTVTILVRESRARDADYITMRDAEYIRGNIDTVKWVTTPVQTICTAATDDTTGMASLAAIDGYFSQFGDIEIVHGRAFTDIEFEDGRTSVIIDRVGAVRLFGAEDAVGETFSVRKSGRQINVTVVGVCESITSQMSEMMAMYADDADSFTIPFFLYIPFETAGRLIDDLDVLSSINIMAVAPELSAEAADSTIRALQTRHGNEDREVYRSRDMASILKQINSIINILTVFISSVAGISLLVGGIGVMNIMLVSVTERTREIGIRKAIGATTSDIMMQFITESVILTLTGGAIGILAGIGLSYGIAFAVRNLGEIHPSLSLQSVLIAVVFSSAVGLFFGIYPARKAANLNPIDALRYE